MNCNAQTLRTLHAYEGFIEKTMGAIIRQYESLPRGTYASDIEIEEKGAENAAKFSQTELFCDAILARSSWQTLQHKRHMRVVYGKIV